MDDIKDILNRTDRIEVIDIDSSSGEEEDEQNGNSNLSNIRGINNQVEEKKPAATLNTLKISGPAQILEARRKKIDELLEYYGDTHNRLFSLLPFMNPDQKAKWHELLNAKQSQILPESLEEPQFEPQSQSSNHLNDLRNEYARERSQIANRIRRVAQVRKYKYRKGNKRRSPKKYNVNKRTPSSRSTTTTATKSSATKSSTYTPKVTVKTEHKPSRSTLFAHVKKER